MVIGLPLPGCTVKISAALPADSDTRVVVYNWSTSMADKLTDEPAYLATNLSITDCTGMRCALKAVARNW